MKKTPYVLPPGERISPPLCDECRIDTLAVGPVAEGRAWWLCQKHLDRARQHGHWALAPQP